MPDDKTVSEKSLIEEIEDFLADPESNFDWKEFKFGGTYVCGFCGSQNNRVGGMKAHIRNVHMSKGSEA